MIKQDIYIECTACGARHSNKNTTRITVHRLRGVTLARTVHLCPSCARDVMAPMANIPALTTR